MLPSLHLPIDEPDCRSTHCSPRTCCCSSTASSIWPRHESMSAEGSGQGSVAAAPRGHRVAAHHRSRCAAADVELQAQAEIDGVRLLASLAFEGYGPAIVPATSVPRWLKGDFHRVQVPELPRASRRLGAAPPPCAGHPDADACSRSARSSSPCKARSSRCARRHRGLPARPRRLASTSSLTACRASTSAIESSAQSVRRPRVRGTTGRVGRRRRRVARRCVDVGLVRQDRERGVRRRAPTACR
jgi:hypothetical protein